MEKRYFLFHYLDRLSAIIFRIPVSKVRHKPNVAQDLAKDGYKTIGGLFEALRSLRSGIKNGEVARRLKRYGSNEVVREKRDFWVIRLLKSFNNPLIILLIFLATISLITKDASTATIILIMVCGSVAIRYWQENQAYNAAESLRALVRTTCTVIRGGRMKEIDLKMVVPGDIVALSAGDIVPADVRLIESKELFVNQSLLTGESVPVEKHAVIPSEKIVNPLELQDLCFMGTNIESGVAEALVLRTGERTYFGGLAKNVMGQRVLTSFDKGIDQFTWLMIRFMLVMAPLVLFINGFGKGNWLEAFLFSISVAVGLTPEMLPAIVTINLSKGAVSMSKKKVIVKRLNSIQNFGAMDILCADKTGTLTQNKIVLIKHIDIMGQSDVNILQYAYLNSYYQTGFKNVLDEAVIGYTKAKDLATVKKGYKKIDELPFDFVRKRMSVVLQDERGQKFLICKGAVEEVAGICKNYESNKILHKVRGQELQKIKFMNEEFSKDGFRVIAVAYKRIGNQRVYYSKEDEKDMNFLGFMTFLDPPKETAVLAIRELQKNGLEIKVLTGDNELVTRKICSEVGLYVKNVLLGDQIEDMDDKELEKEVEDTTIFAKLSPDDKKRVIEALQQKKHVVGFLGDGINDAPGLRVSDVGISVNTAVDIGRESADIILLEMNLMVLADGVLEGRRVFGNIIKYIKMGASSNFGNMFSVVGASLILPFLPMTPLQLLINNLLYNMSQTAIPTDSVDKEYIRKPRKWEIGDIRRFMFFIGPISSIFDYATFGAMAFIFHALNNPSLFQTGWFVESLLTQTLIVHVIRSRKIPFIQTWASKPLIFTTLTIMGIGIFLTLSPFAHLISFKNLPLLYWPILVLILFSYAALTQMVKTWYIKRFGYN